MGSSFMSAVLPPAMSREEKPDMDNTHVHPIFAGIVGAFASSHQDAAAIQRAAYVSMLRKHDWSHDFSDDPRVAREGREALAQLRILQRAIDADFSLWNKHCDPACINGASYH